MRRAENRVGDLPCCGHLPGLRVSRHQGLLEPGATAQQDQPEETAARQRIRWHMNLTHHSPPDPALPNRILEAPVLVASSTTRRFRPGRTLALDTLNLSTV